MEIVRTQSNLSTNTTSAASARTTNSTRSVRTIASNFRASLKNLTTKIKSDPTDNSNFDPERADMLEDDNMCWGPTCNRRKTAIDC